VSAALRETERVTPLELFFDLIFVLAITQCTSIMAHEPTWSGVAKGLLALGLLWWSWVGYAWLTSVVDPEEGAVRFVIFAAMAAMLVVTVCIPEAFDDLALTFAIAYAIVRVAHIALFVLGSRGDEHLRASVIGLAVSTALAVGLLVTASFLHGVAQCVLWSAALAFDVLGPLLFGSSGWKLVPRHFAERHGLIVLIALGESIVAIGVGTEHGVDNGVIAGVVLGMICIAGLWWTYFDLAALITTDRLERAEVGRIQNEMARDAYSLLHFPMVAGIVLFALGMKLTIGDLGHAPATVPAVALCGGVSLYFVGHVGFKRRTAGTIGRPRIALAVVLLAYAPLARHVSAAVTMVVIAAGVWIVITYETLRTGSWRRELRYAAAHDDVESHVNSDADHTNDRTDDRTDG